VTACAQIDPLQEIALDNPSNAAQSRRQVPGTHLNPKMKTISIKVTLLILTLFAAGAGLRAADALSGDVAKTPAFKTFLTKYVAAINSKDRARLNECIHAKSLAMMAGDQTLADYWFGHRFKYSIPADYKVYTTAIPNNKPLPLANQGVIFPVKPTYQVQISYMRTPTNGVGIILWAVNEDDQWHEVVPSAPKKN
jgi:hypothetical protein